MVVSCLISVSFESGVKEGLELRKNLGVSDVEEVGVGICWFGGQKKEKTRGKD